MFSYFRVVERPGYEDHAQAFPGSVPHTETVGFLTDLSGRPPLDFTTAHELAHMWWGGLAYGAQDAGPKDPERRDGPVFPDDGAQAAEGPSLVAADAGFGSWGVSDRQKRARPFRSCPSSRPRISRPISPTASPPTSCLRSRSYLGEDKINRALRRYLERLRPEGGRRFRCRLTS